MAGNPRRTQRGYEMGLEELLEYLDENGEFPRWEWIAARLDREHYCPVVRGYAQATVTIGAMSQEEADALADVVLSPRAKTRHAARWISTRGTSDLGIESFRLAVAS